MTRLLLIALLLASLTVTGVRPASAASTCETIRQSLPTSFDPLASVYGCRSVKAYKWVSAPGFCNREARKLGLIYGASIGEVVVHNYFDNGCLFDSTTMSYVRQ